MKIKDIKNIDTRNIAIKYARIRSKKWGISTKKESIINLTLTEAFRWESSKEGHEFWLSINQQRGERSPLSN